MPGSVRYLPPSPESEAQLVAGLRRGDAAGYRHLYDSYAPALLRLLCGIAGDESLARDAVQATFLIVFRAIDRFEGRSSLRTWITRIGLREAARLRTRAAPALPEPEPAPSPEAITMEAEQSRRLRGLLAELPREKREALLMFEIGGMSVQEIADIAEEPRGTILARLSRTRAELREALVAWDEGRARGETT
jgi:RNA polymerase sigma-70 factor (ECF subfamily)